MVFSRFSPWNEGAGMQRNLRGVVFLSAVLALAACGSHEAKKIAQGMAESDQPDKILYDRALVDIARSRHDIGRLTLQTLINTYPDSEYLAKAKLAIADAYFREGGTAGLTQAQAEYKDFITFFPTAPEAPEAQYKVGLAYYRRLSKAGRDLAQARMAEAEFKEFILRYPDSYLLRKVKAKLRQVQELVASANFRIAHFYYQRQAYKAAISRLEEIADDYPAYSRADESIWMLADTLEKVGKKDESVVYYARVVSDYPLSPYVEPSKQRLVTMGIPAPRPTRATMIRAQWDQRRRKGQGLFSRFAGIMSSKPNLSATRRGPVRPTQTPVMVLAKDGKDAEGSRPKTTPGGARVGSSVVLKPITSGGDGASQPEPAADGVSPGPASNGPNFPVDSGNPEEKSKEEEKEESPEE